MTLLFRWGGLLLGLVFFATALLVKPIGVSNKFVTLDRVISDSPYLEAALYGARLAGGKL